MKNARKIIAIIMSVFFLISLIPTMVLADETVVISNQFGYDSSGNPIVVYNDSKNTNITWSEDIGGLGGKAQDDKSFVFTATEIPANADDKSAGVKYAGLDYNKDYVFEMNILVDGADATVNYMYEDNGFELIKYLSDGTFMYRENDTYVDAGKYETGKWHRLVIWYDGTDGTSQRRRHSIYLDGVRLTENGKNMTNTAAVIMPGINAYTSSEGTVAFDDFKAYYVGGDYVPDAADSIKTTDSADLKFNAETNTVTYNSGVYSTPAELIDVIKAATDCTYAGIFDDSTLSESASELTDSSILVFTSPNGSTYSYWSLKSIYIDENTISNEYGYNKDGNEIGVYNDYKNTNITWSESVGGLGGKAQGDKSFVFTATEIPANADDKSAGVKYAGLDYNKDYVFEMNVLVDGAEATVNFQYEDNGYELIKYLSDGTFLYRENDTYVEAASKYETGKWHRLVIWYDGTDGTSSRRRHSIYLDGVRLTENGKYLTNGAAMIMPGINAYTSFEGTVAFDDFKAYYVGGDYTPDSADAIVTENSDNLIFDTSAKTITYNKYAYSTTDALIAAVKTAAGCTYASLLDNDTLVFTSPNGKSYAYYTIKKMTEEEAMMSTVGLSSNSNLVYVLDSSVGVVSHSLDDDYYTDSTEVIAALSSSNGYTLSYVDADKNEADDVDSSVTDGFIKAVKGENVFYIPVETKGKVNTDISVSPAGVAAALDNDRTGYVTVSTTASSAIGGKNAEEIDYVITSANVPSTATAATVGLMYKSLPAIATTFEMSVYMDGDAEFAFNTQWEESTFEAMRIEDDGTIVYDNNGSYVTAPNKVETGKWHRVAITYDASRTRCIIYVDGNIITDNTRILDTKTVMLGAGGGTTNGTVAIADFESYYGYYNYIDVVRAENGKITASVDSDLLDGECFFALAEYAEGEMVTIAPMTVSKANNVPVTLDFNAESTYKAFLWKNDASAPIATSVRYR